MAVDQGDAAGYVGPAELRNAAVVGLFGDGSILRVILKTEGGAGLTLTFRDVAGVVEKRAENMRVSGVTRSPAGAPQRFVFVNRERDDARLEITAASFEISSSP